MSKKGNTSDKPTNAFVVLSDGGTITDKSQLAKFQQSTVEQLALIATTEHGNVVRRLFVGLALHGIKASMKRGEWLPWLKKHAKGSSYRQTAYMMSASLAFVEKTKIARDEVKALASGAASLELDSKNATTQKIAIAATKFVGEQSWGELLDAHGIREKAKLGGARVAAKGDDGGAPSNEQLYLFARDEIGLVLNQAETLLLKENRLLHLADHPEEIRGVVESLRSLAEKVEAAAKPILKK